MLFIENDVEHISNNYSFKHSYGTARFCLKNTSLNFPQVVEMKC